MSEDPAAFRARIEQAVAIHGSASAHLNADGSVSIVVPTNDLAQARERKANKHKKWRGVTNELIITHANPDCPNCSGHGYTGPEEDGDVCERKGCAVELFSIAYKGRLRHNKQKNRLEVFV